LVNYFRQDALVSVARITTQLTPDSLLPLEQFSIGGGNTVRGYRQNQRVADNGIFGSWELRLPVYNQPDVYGRIELAPFFDVGTVWENQGEVTSPRTLVSTGIGLRWQVDPFFEARLDWGIPLNEVDDRGDSLQDQGLIFSVRVQPF
jgi:hemolysin activation/secretion protein